MDPAEVATRIVVALIEHTNFGYGAGGNSYQHNLAEKAADAYQVIYEAATHPEANADERD